MRVPKLIIIIVTFANLSPGSTSQVTGSSVFHNDSFVATENGTHPSVARNWSLHNTKDFLPKSSPQDGKLLLGSERGLGRLSSVMLSPVGIRPSELLNQLKTKIFERIHSTAGNAVKARDGYGGWHGGWSGGGGVGFPSLEAALLSLAFLTFAVFLIDLIQQFVARFRVGGTVTPMMVGRKRRSATPFHQENEDESLEEKELSTLTSKILTSIENPLFHKY